MMPRSLDDHVRSFSPVVLAALCLSSIYFSCISARAEDSIQTGSPATDEARKQLAKKHFARGTNLFTREEYLAAARAFEEAYRIEPHDAVLANIALCYDKAGDILRAVEAYRSYLDQPLENQPNADLRDRLRELEKQIGEIIVSCPEEGCQIVIDEVVKNTNTDSFLLLPGTYWIEGVVGDVVLDHQKIKLLPGARVQVLLKSSPSPSEATASPKEKAGVDNHAQRQPGPGPAVWVTGSVAIAAGITTIALGVATLKTHQNFEESGSSDVNLMDRGESYRTATNVALGVTIVLAAATIISGIVYRKKKNAGAGEPRTGVAPGTGAYVRF